MTLSFPTVTVPSFRFHERHARKTVRHFLEQTLTDFGWVNDPVNMGTFPANFLDEFPEVGDTSLEPTAVSVTFGQIPNDTLEELGGGLYSVAIPLFVDVWAEKWPIAESVCSDVKYILKDRVIPVYDFTASTPVETNEQIEFLTVIGPERPPAAEQLSGLWASWRIVKATANLIFVNQD